jgi:hypothetical protein
MIGGPDDCMGRNELRMEIPPALLAGAVAEHLIRSRYSRADLSLLNVPATSPPQSDGARNGFERLASCVVSRDPEGVRALVLTQPAGEDEPAAIARLSPHLAPCLSAGVTIEFNRATLRAVLATGLYRALSAEPERQPPG